MKKNQNKFTVLRSGQERLNFWDFVEDDFCTGTVQCPVETGDYVIKDAPRLISLERKYSTGEVYNNLFEKRFTKELERLMEFKYRYIICQFTAQDVIDFPRRSNIPDRYHDGLKANGSYILSRLASITLKYNIPVIYAGSASKAVAYTLLKQAAKLEGII